MRRYLAVVSVLALFAFGAVVARNAIREHRVVVEVVHWSNSHLMRDGLLPSMAKKFNAARHMTASGALIKVVVVNCDSAVQVADLTRRLKGSGPAENGCTDGKGATAKDPAIVTPQSDDWLVDLNANLGRQVVDRTGAPHIAETWLGIVTYGAVADCLGWTGRAVSYGEVLALVTAHDGWGAHSDCAKTDWGSPKLAFTNPSTSSSGRNVLVSLYSMAAHKAPAALTVDDVQRDDVVQFVAKFESAVDHYMPGTIPLNTKIAQGKKYGQFFLMPEDNLVSQAQGTERAIAADGTAKRMTPVDDLVMIYPKEGAVLNSHPAAMVDGPWVTAAQATAAREWIEFLRAERQQRAFMRHGFRPAAGTGLSVDARQFAKWGLDARTPSSTIDPGDLDPAVLHQIVGSWRVVKKPAVVTFLVDVSGSMEGKSLDAVKDGLSRLVDTMAGSAGAGRSSQVALIAFSGDVVDWVTPTPILGARTKARLGDAIAALRADGQTALYDAVSHAIDVTADADADPGATRAVVVLSDGASNTGRLCLDDLVGMESSTAETTITKFCGSATDPGAVDEHGAQVAEADVVGDHLLRKPAHDVQVFFIGFGEADVNIGRILAQATDAEYQGKTDADLANVIDALGAYF
ncbi:MAG: hypothetical protein RJA49_1135 [Actinomycetota bacterium]